MSKLDQFLDIIKAEFPEDRLTWQKNVPTFHPENAADAAKLFKLANKLGRPQLVSSSRTSGAVSSSREANGADGDVCRPRLFITGYGNNIDPIGKPFVDMVSIRTDRLNKLSEIKPQDFYIKVGSGYPLKELYDDLKPEQLLLPHSTLPYVGSIGGSLAVNLSAELNGHTLPLRRYFIQAEVVTPSGEIITPGSPCFKSVSGYDIVKIFAGSWGLLGLIVSATFRVLPITAEHEYQSMKLNSIDRTKLLGALDEAENATDAVYSRKIKSKFDPVGVLPVV